MARSAYNYSIEYLTWSASVGSYFFSRQQVSLQTDILLPSDDVRQYTVNILFNVNHFMELLGTFILKFLIG